MELGVIFLLLLGILIYFTPSLLALSRNHHNSMAIIMLNLFLGWTFLGWVLALIWAGTAVSPIPGAYQNHKPDDSNTGY